MLEASIADLCRRVVMCWLEQGTRWTHTNFIRSPTRSVGYDYYEDCAVKVKHKVRDDQGKIIEVTETAKVVSLKKRAKADTTAQIFYLSNRRPDIWRRNAQNNSEVAIKEEMTTHVTGEEALAAMKREGFVLLEGEYELVEGGDADESVSKANAEEASL
jgi:hypothetical protein